MLVWMVIHAFELLLAAVKLVSTFNVSLAQADFKFISSCFSTFSTFLESWVKESYAIFPVYISTLHCSCAKIATYIPVTKSGGTRSDVSPCYYSRRILQLSHSLRRWTQVKPATITRIFEKYGQSSDMISFNKTRALLTFNGKVGLRKRIISLLTAVNINRRMVSGESKRQLRTIPSQHDRIVPLKWRTCFCLFRVCHMEKSGRKRYRWHFW